MDRFEKKKPSWLSLLSLIAGNFILIVDVFIVNVALIDIRKNLKTTEAELQAIVVIYSIFFGALLMNGARLGDIFGRRKIYLLGVFIFFVSSLVCGLAQVPSELIIGRAIQGVGASLMMPQIYSSLRVIYSGRAQKRAFSAMGAAQGLAGIISQLIGGLLIKLSPHLGWRLVFLVNIPFAMFIFLFGRISIPETHGDEAIKTDFVGALLGAMAVSFFLVSLMEGRQYEWPLWSFGLMLSSFVLLFGFLRHERNLKVRGGVPIIDINLFSIGYFGLGITAIFLLYSAIGSFFFILTMLLQRGLDMTPLQAGSFFTPSAIAFFVGSLLFPKIERTVKWKALPIGIFIIAAGIITSIIGVSFERTNQLIIVISLILVGLGQGITIPMAISSVLSGLNSKNSGMASGAVSTLQMVGSAFGVAVVGVIFFAFLNESGGGYKTYAISFSIASMYNVIATILSAAIFGWISHKRLTYEVD